MLRYSGRQHSVTEIKEQEGKMALATCPSSSSKVTGVQVAEKSRERVTTTKKAIKVRNPASK